MSGLSGHTMNRYTTIKQLGDGTYGSVLLGRSIDVIPALVLTGAEELYEYAPVTGTDYEIPVCSGDMLFNVLDEYLGFLN